MLAVVSPLGLSSGEMADQVALAFGVRGSAALGTPLADVLARAFALLPFGEAGIRGLGVAGISTLLALAFLVAAVRGLSLGPGDGLPRGSGAPVAVHGARGLSLLSIGAGISLLCVCRPFLETATGHPATAVELGLLIATILAMAAVRRSPRRASVGMALALLCGLGAGVGWPVRAATWPPALVISTWALRRGQRWPLLSPTLFVAGCGIALAGVVDAPPSVPVTLWALLRFTLIPVPGHTVFHDVLRTREMLAWVIDDVGVLGLLVAAVGLCLVVSRARAKGALTFVGSWTMAITACLWTGDILAARLFFAAALVAPIAAAVVFFTASFGRARAAVAVVMVVIIVVPPAVVGIGAAMRTPVRRQPALVARGLDAAFSGRAKGAVAPADPEQARWWRYGHAIGLVAAPAASGKVPGVKPDAP